ncbi:MAG: HoxN/HupN/NixA family nickel/cobalt transporter [Thermoplasmata archaeon]
MGGPAAPSTSPSLPSSPSRSMVLSAREKLLIVAVYTAIAAATTVGFLLLLVVARAYALFLPLGVLSYTLGLRHGVDADHISAIDNTTRKLLQQEQRPLTVGTWFSLGHSTIVVGMIVVLVLAFDFVNHTYGTFAAVGSVFGTVVSGAFLWIIGLINLVIVLEIYRIFQGLRAGRLSEEGLEEQLNKRGFMNRYFGRLFRVVNRPWQMYPVGVLFGLGFDTASEVTVIALTLGLSTGLAPVPVWTALLMPLLFTCGMVAVDTTDGIAMRYAYGWAFLKPIRKVYYNLTITIISVLVAFVIGTLEVLTVIAYELGLSGPFWNSLNAVNGETAWQYVGFGIIALFVGTWLVAMAVYRYRRYEDIGFPPRSPPPSPAGESPPSASRIES